MVIDAKDGAVLGNVDLGGTPEQTVGDGKGTIYQVLQDRPGGVAVIDVIDGGGPVRIWELRFFEQVAGDRYRLSREEIHEVAFPEADVRTALEPRFGEVGVEDENGRLWFACRDPRAAR